MVTLHAMIPTIQQAAEIDEYLRLPIENVKDPLIWRNNLRTYPNLSRMALDYLSIPGMLLNYSAASH